MNMAHERISILQSEGNGAGETGVSITAWSYPGQEPDETVPFLLLPGANTRTLTWR